VLHVCVHEEPEAVDPVPQDPDPPFDGADVSAEQGASPQTAEADDKVPVVHVRKVDPDVTT